MTTLVNGANAPGLRFSPPQKGWQYWNNLSAALIKEAYKLASPNYADEWTPKAILKFRAAYDAIVKALSMGAIHKSVWLNKAIVCQHLGKLDEALDAYNQALRLDSYNANLYAYRAKIYLQLGLYDSAQNDFERALSLQPDNRYAQVHYAARNAA